MIDKARMVADHELTLSTFPKEKINIMSRELLLWSHWLQQGISCQVLNTLKARTGEKFNEEFAFVQGIMSYLIVDNNVNGAIGGVVGQVTQVEGLIHNTLAGKGGITMDQNTHHLSNKARHREEDKLR